MDARRALRSLLVPLTGGALLAGAAPAAADSAPELRSARFAKPAIVGRTATLRLRAVDKERTVSGAVVAFAGEGSYGTSACRPEANAPASDERGRRRGGRSRAGRASTISVPHRFTAPGPRPMLVRIDSSGCAGGGGVLLQPFTVTPVAPGEPPQEPVASGSPVSILGSLLGTGAPSGGEGGSGVNLPPGVTDPNDALPDVGPLPVLPKAPSSPVELPKTEDVVPALPGLPRAVAAAACANADLVPTATNRRRIVRATLCLLNAERAAHNLGRVRLNRRLSRAATAHSRDMVARNYFGHVAPDGGDLVKRLIGSRWLPRPPGWEAGENIAFGETPLSTPRATVAGWMASSGHRENNLDPIWRLAGIGVVPAVPGSGPLPGATYTAIFGR
jgi:uncharacterized protein YkwD